MLPSEAEPDGDVLTLLRRGTLDYAVLATLARAPSYGHALARTLSEHGTLLTSQGTLYPLLSRLRRQGWVASSWEESTQGPPRRVYELSDDGRAALTRFTAVWTDYSRSLDTVLRQGHS